MKTIESYTSVMEDSYLIVKKYGYEYYLREVDFRGGQIPQPCFMGLQNMVLVKCKKIEKERK